MLTRLILCACLLLSSCGYHLVGQGGDSDVIAADSQILLHSLSPAESSWLRALRSKLEARYRIVDDAEHALDDIYQIRLIEPNEQLVPVAYDVSGIAIQYQLRLAAGIWIGQQGKEIWQSGIVSVSGDVFASGDPADILAQQDKLSSELRESWATSVRARMRSGF